MTIYITLLHRRIYYPLHFFSVYMDGSDALYPHHMGIFFFLLFIKSEFEIFVYTYKII